MTRRFGMFGLVLALLVGGSVGSARTQSGTWKLVFVGDNKGAQPRTFTEILLQLDVQGNKVTGTATAGDWPGVMPVSEGTIAGNRLSFVTVGTESSSSGLPKAIFDATLDGDTMKATVTWTIVGLNDASARKLTMEGKRVTVQ